MRESARGCLRLREIPHVAGPLPFLLRRRFASRDQNAPVRTQSHAQHDARQLRLQHATLSVGLQRPKLHAAVRFRDHRVLSVRRHAQTRDVQLFGKRMILARGRAALHVPDAEHLVPLQPDVWHRSGQFAAHHAAHGQHFARLAAQRHQMRLLRAFWQRQRMRHRPHEVHMLQQRDQIRAREAVAWIGAQRARQIGR